MLLSLTMSETPKDGLPGLGDYLKTDPLQAIGPALVHILLTTPAPEGLEDEYRRVRLILVHLHSIAEGHPLEPSVLEEFPALRGVTEKDAREALKTVFVKPRGVGARRNHTLGDEIYRRMNRPQVDGGKQPSLEQRAMHLQHEFEETGLEIDSDAIQQQYKRTRKDIRTADGELAEAGSLDAYLEKCVKERG